MKQFIRINGKKFSLEELAEKLGLSGPVSMVSLCQKSASGILCADLPVCMNGSYPAVELTFEFPEGVNPTRLPVARLAQDEECASAEPQCFLYGRGDSYIAFTDVNTQTDDEYEKDPQYNVLVVSGDRGDVLHLFRENSYINDMGSLMSSVQ